MIIRLFSSKVNFKAILRCYRVEAFSISITFSYIFTTKKLFRFTSISYCNL